MIKFLATSFRELWSDVRFRFLILGAWNTIFSYLIFLALMSFDSNKSNSTTLILLFSSIIGIAQAFTIQKYFVWRSRERVHSEVYKFLTLSMIQLAVNVIALGLAMNLTEISPQLLQGLLALFIILFSYLVQKFFIFNSKSTNIDT